MIINYREILEKEIRENLLSQKFLPYNVLNKSISLKNSLVLND